MSPNRTALAAALTMISLSGCATSTLLVERPNLPAAPDSFGKAIAIPVIRKGDSIKVVAAEHRAALHTANRRLESDRQFYDGVRREFGREK